MRVRVVLCSLMLLPACQQTCLQKPMKWAATVSADTIADSWGTWKTNYGYLQPNLTRAGFEEAVKHGAYSDLPVDEYLKLDIENQPRLVRAINAKTPEEVECQSFVC